MELPEFTAVLDEMTKNTYVMVVVHDPTIGASLSGSLNVVLNLEVCRNSWDQNEYSDGSSEIRRAARR